MAVTWKRTAGLVWEEFADETLVISPAAGSHWSLNALASSIWLSCDGSHGIEDLAAALAHASSRSLHAVRAELAAFCDALAEAGLLRAASRGRQAAELRHGLIAARVSGALGPAPSFRQLNLASGPRRRPSPRGNSGPG